MNGKTLSPEQVAEKIEYCKGRVAQLTFGGTTLERHMWFVAKQRVADEACSIRPTSRSVACLLDSAAGILGGFLLAPEENLRTIKSLTEVALGLASEAASEMRVQLHAGAVK